MTAIVRHRRSAAKNEPLRASRPSEVVQKKPDIQPRSRTRHCAKPSLAGEGRGEGVSASEAPLEERALTRKRERCSECLASCLEPNDRP
jgi:hypothetical protein